MAKTSHLNIQLAMSLKADTPDSEPASVCMLPLILCPQKRSINFTVFVWTLLD